MNEGNAYRTGRNHIVNDRLPRPPARNVYASHCTIPISFNPSVSIGKEKPTFSKSLLVKIVTRGMYMIAMHEPKAHVLK